MRDRQPNGPSELQGSGEGREEGRVKDRKKQKKVDAAPTATAGEGEQEAELADQRRQGSEGKGRSGEI